MKEPDYVFRRPEVSVTLKELRKKHGLKQWEMADKLGIPRPEYVKAENGDPPVWMGKAVRFFQACFELGYLPENIALPSQPPIAPPKPEKYSA
jgi:DNA-binding XRE family transcriptional regulator